jgi:hypothetical protein
MSVAAPQAAAFYREVARERKVWTVRDGEGIPAPRNASGERAMPFWSSRTRAEAVIKASPAYADFKPVEISWDEFCKKWLPGLTKDGIRVGVNWSGPRAVGYDIEPAAVLRNVQAIEGDKD